MIGSQLGLSAQTPVNKDKKKRHTPEQVMEHQTNQMVKMLMLDDDTTAKFIPVYQNYLKELRECRMMNRAKQRVEGTVREKYYNEFRKILSPKQIMKIYQTEQNNADKLKKEFDRRKKQTVAQGKQKRPVRPVQKS